MVAVAEPQARQSFFLTRIDVNGNSFTVPNAGGFVYMYEPGSTVPRTTWLDSTQTAANTNPILLDPDGRCSIWGVGQYRQLVTDAHGNEQWDGLVELGIDQTFVPGTILDVPIEIDGPNPNPPLNNPVQGTRPLNAVLGSFVDARNFGPLRQGSDDLPIIQAALDYAAGIGGATVYLGPGPLSTVPASQLVWSAGANGVTLRGDGPETTVLTINNSVTQDCFVLTAGNLRGCQIRDMGFGFSGSPGGGAVIHAANTYQLHVENVRMLGPFSTGILIAGGGNQHFTTLRDVSCLGTADSVFGIVLGDTSQGIVHETVMDGCELQYSRYGIYLVDAQTTEVNNTMCLGHSQIGVVTAAPVGSSVISLNLVGVLCENCAAQGFDLGDLGGSASLISLVNCWATGNGIGVLVGGNPRESNISIIGCQITVNQQQGIRQDGASNVLVSGNMLSGNSVSSDGGYDAIRIGSGSNNVVNNNVIIGGPGNRHAYGIAISLGTTNSVIVGNSTANGHTGSILDAGGVGVGNVIANNTGA